MPSPAVLPPPADRLDAQPAHVPPPVSAGLPDVAVSTAPGVSGRLDRVGMSGVQAVAEVTVEGRSALLPALCELSVSLDDPDSRGIHMSRLYLRAQRSLEGGLTPARLAALVGAMRQSHDGISEVRRLRGRPHPAGAAAGR